jgi:small subunit ribosomal protein S1
MNETQKPKQTSPEATADSSPEPSSVPGLKAHTAEETSSPADLEQAAASEKSPKVEPKKEAASASKQTTPKEKGKDNILYQVLEKKIPIKGKVIGWNKGGFHIVVDGVAAFCPRSEMEIGNPRDPKSYIDQEFDFLILKIQEKGRRIIVSRSSCLMAERTETQKTALKGLEIGAIVEGTVASTTDFGAFVDLNGVQGLVHISELSQRRVNKPEEVVQVGQTVKVKVLKLSQDKKRISLSIKALEPNPWNSILERYPGGSLTKGRVERTNRYGAFIELEPGITGLLPTSGMSLPRDTSPARAYPPGREISVQVLSIDSKKHRISLGLEGSSEEGSRKDFQKFTQQSQDDGGSGFNALASAFAKIQDKTN